MKSVAHLFQRPSVLRRGTLPSTAFQFRRRPFTSKNEGPKVIGITTTPAHIAGATLLMFLGGAAAGRLSYGNLLNGDDNSGGPRRDASKATVVLKTKMVTASSQTRTMRVAPASMCA